MVFILACEIPTKWLCSRIFSTLQHAILIFVIFSIIVLLLAFFFLCFLLLDDLFEQVLHVIEALFIHLNLVVQLLHHFIKTGVLRLELVRSKLLLLLILLHLFNQLVHLCVLALLLLVEQVVEVLDHAVLELIFHRLTVHDQVIKSLDLLVILRVLALHDDRLS